MKKYLFLLLVLLSADAYAMTADEIMARSNAVSYYQGDDGRAFVNMVITDAQGRQRNREFVILRKDTLEGKEQKFFIYFSEPADVRDMVYMVWKNDGTDDDRWLYLQALDLVKRIASGDKRTSFAGSHFLYEDVSGRSLEDDVHELINETDRVYVIKNTPRDPSGLEFSYYTVEVDKNNFLPLRGVYYNSSGEKQRELTVEEVKDIQGFATPVTMIANDFERGGNTVITYSLVEYNIGLEDDIFTERSLKRPPRKFINK